MVFRTVTAAIAIALSVTGSAMAAEPARAIPEDQLTLPVNEADRDEAYRAAMAAHTALLDGLRPVDDARLAAPAGADWLAWRGTSATQGYSDLKQIDRANVGNLGLAWSLSLAPGTNAIAPVVHDGVMFIHSNGTVQALDARTGERLWRYARPATAKRIPFDQPRGIVLYGDAVYVPTVDNHIVALDAKTGALRWDHAIDPADSPVQITSAPIAARGKIIQGMSGCHGSDMAGGCYIVALDAVTGKEAWRFHTVARPGDPGGDSWNGAGMDKRFGASVWATGSYDPDLNLLFFGTGQTYTISTLIDPQPRKGESADALYTNSTLALDPDTGKLVWYYQHGPRDLWNLDWAFEQTIVEQEGRKIIVTGGKIGIFDALDAKTGRYLWSYDLGLQNLVTKIDPKTGRKSYDPALMPEMDKPKFTCPSSIGNRNWMTTAYDPQSQLLYVPVIPSCMDFSRREDKPGLSMLDHGEMRLRDRRPLGSDGNHGWIAAIDLTKRKGVWTDRRRAPEVSGILATAGGIVFGGGRDRVLRALDSLNGETLWETRLPAVPSAFPISYGVDGVQYVAVVAGGGTILDYYMGATTPEFPPSETNKTIMVFALPRSARAVAQ